MDLYMCACDGLCMCVRVYVYVCVCVCVMVIHFLVWYKAIT